MTDNWKEWEGRTVDGKFVLGTYLGGSEGSAVFRTRVDEDPAGVAADAAIKLMAVVGSEAEAQLRWWKAAGELRHPNLVRILAVGRYAEGHQELVYAVEEYAEENLGQIVPQRALSGEEARGMLGPVLGALEYIHGKGMVHGRVRPANILAAGDEVKLSSDDLRMAGEMPRAASAYSAPEVAAQGVSPASDVWSLGMMLVEAMTQRLPSWDRAGNRAPDVGANVPEPFREISRRCLVIDPEKRAGAREILDRMEGRVPPRVEGRLQNQSPVRVSAAEQKISSKWPYWVAAAVVAALAIFLVMRNSSSGPPKDESAAVQSGPSQSSESQPAQSQRKTDSVGPQAKPSPGGDAPDPGDTKVRTKGNSANDQVVERVMPQVSPNARRTIDGHIKVRVKVKVDPEGNVSQASFREAGPSKYFARVAMEAAKRWKFAPAEDQNSHDWILLFVFSRARTEASAAQSR